MYLALVVGVLEEVAVYLLGNGMGGNLADFAVQVLLAVVPCEFRNGVWIGAARLFVELLDAEEQFVDYLGVRQRLAGRVDGLVPPLGPPSGVGDAALLLYGERAWKLEDLRLDVRRVYARAHPERARLVVKEVDVDHPVKLRQGLARLDRV